MQRPRKRTASKQERVREEEQYFAISAVAKMVNTHPQTIRLYEREGFLHPKRNHHNIRLFSADDVERIRKVQHLTQDMGVNLAGVEVIFKLMDRINDLETRIRKVKQSMPKRVEETAKTLALQMFDMFRHQNASGDAPLRQMNRVPPIRSDDMKRITTWLEELLEEGTSSSPGKVAKDTRRR